MGKPRYIYFNDVIDDRMKTVPNKSALINGLLKEYFEKNDIEQMNTKQLIALKEIRALERDTDKKIKELRTNGNR